MRDVTVLHRTTYRYARPVRLELHRLMVRPQDSHDLRLTNASLSVFPAPLTTRWTHDVFGNSVCLLEWDPRLETSELEIVSRLELQHFPGGASLPQATLDRTAEILPFSYASAEIPDLARLTERHLPDPDRRVDAWVRQFLGNTSGAQTLEVLEAINRAIRREFKYVTRIEEGTQTPLQTMNNGSGACRDFALFMMEAVRTLGLAARFVSGYLYDSENTSTIGGGATHAWCSVYLPGAGWVEYDPTNGLFAGDNLIRVAATRTPEQAITVSGGFVGTIHDALAMEVDVQVTASAPGGG